MFKLGNIFLGYVSYFCGEICATYYWRDVSLYLVWGLDEELTRHGKKTSTLRNILHGFCLAVLAILVTRVPNLQPFYAWHRRYHNSAVVLTI